LNARFNGDFPSWIPSRSDSVRKIETSRNEGRPAYLFLSFRTCLPATFVLPKFIPRTKSVLLLRPFFADDAITEVTGPQIVRNHGTRFPPASKK
jgi:hypothetical protein